jgi:putative transposase
MPYSRKSIVYPGLPGVYHCISRCVRRAWLCGKDLLTKKDYEHRRLWIYQRIQELSKIFAIEVFACSVLNNHYHIVLRVDPEEATNWSDEEVVRRWDQVYSVSKALTGMSNELDKKIMRMALERPDLINEWRARLSSISWFMKQINEPLARSANKEDGCKGRFWEGRFKCQHLVDESAVLACMAYVDLNPIRAGMADSPEKSDLTSAQDRIFAFQAQEHSKTETSSTWQQPKNSDTTSEPMKNRADWLTPVESIRVGQEQRGWLLTLEEYLTILDETGRCMKDGKRGVIPQGLAPILSRMKLRQENWLLATQRFGNRFYRISGRIERMAEAAKKVGQKWFQGMSFSKEVFLN